MNNFYECTFLNGHGDITISWNDDDHNDMLNLIEKKINEGYVFFIIETKFLGLSKKEIAINKNNLNLLEKKKNIIIKDKDLDIFVKQSKNADVYNNNNDGSSEYNIKKTVKKETFKDDFKEKQKFIAIKPAVGG